MYQLKSFSKESLAEALSNSFTTASEVERKNHFNYLLGYLADLKCKTIVLEPEYVSKDYLSDYTSYYSLCFEKYPKVCTRVHFFELEFDAEILDTLISGTLTEIDIRGSYLGFIVVKPIPNTVIGFTALKTYTHSSSFNDRNFWGIKVYPVNLFGIKLEVKSLAFQEQDAVVSACATAAIWSVLHGAVDKSNHSILLRSPSEITRDAGNSSDGNRLFPNKSGLEIFQISESIFKAGLVSEIKTQDLNFSSNKNDDPDKVESATKKCDDPAEDEEERVPIDFLKKILNAHSEIGIPIILVVSISGEDNHGLHAITVSGFRKEEPKPIEPR